jgi:polysaccharide chain length determinant protein (PEP-CTERM system associated)
MAIEFPKNKKLDLSDYLSMVVRRTALVVYVAIAVMTLVLIVGYNLPKKYNADSTVFIEKNVLNTLVKGIAFTPEMGDRIRVLKYALLSRDMISKVLEEMDADVFAKDNSAVQEFISSLQSRTNIKVKDEDLFIVSITDKDPKFAQDYINTLVQKYVEENISAKREESYGANRFLDEQLEIFKVKLDKAEDAIIEFRKRMGIYLSIDEKTIMEDIRQYRRAMEEIDLNLDSLNAKKKHLKVQLKSIEPTVTLFSEKQKEDRIANLERRVRELLVTYTKNYPEVLKVEAEIQALRSRTTPEKNAGDGETEFRSANPVFQEVTQKFLETETEVSSMLGRRARFQEMIREREAELRSAPESKKELAVLTQERDSARKIFEEMQMRVNQSEVSKQMEIGDKATTFRIVDPAIFPTKPTFPDKIQLILFALVAGLGAGVGCVLLLENLDGSIKDVDQIQGMGLQLLGVIPVIPCAIEDRRRRKGVFWACATGSVYLCGIFGLLAYETIKRLT